jgi:1-acyl-sn-glycerol-3-phosphate acyltransferase
VTARSAVERGAQLRHAQVADWRAGAAEGPAVLVGNHSGMFYVPEAWVCAQAVLSRRGIGPPAYVLAYDLLFAVPGVGPFLRQLGAVPADAGLVSACYLQITGRMQGALDRLSAEQPHPLLTGCARLGQNLARTALATSSGLRSISASP